MAKIEQPDYYPLLVDKPTIAAIDGACAGIGLVQALMSDVRIAGPAAEMISGRETGPCGCQERGKASAQDGPQAAGAVTAGVPAGERLRPANAPREPAHSDPPHKMRWPTRLPRPTPPRRSR
jgi:hypothetical protein